jgi:YidC/Oxa1 family membrane protein insertase
MTNNMPQLQVLQQKLTDARQAGNAMEGILFTTQVPRFFSLYSEFSNYFCCFEAALMGYEIQSFMKEKGLNPLKNPMVPLIQVITYS